MILPLEGECVKSALTKATGLLPYGEQRKIPTTLVARWLGTQTKSYRKYTPDFINRSSR